MKEIKKVDLKVLAKTGVLVGVGMALIWIGVIFPLIALLMFRFDSVQMFLAFLVNMVFLAVICGLLTTLHFLIIGWIYNLVAKKFGGIKIDLS
jgi:hypothetical protein